MVDRDGRNGPRRLVFAGIGDRVFMVPGFSPPCCRGDKDRGKGGLNTSSALAVGGKTKDIAAINIPKPLCSRNRLLCEPLFLAHYIERAGTGTLDIVRLCTESGMPEPEFRDEAERFTSPGGCPRTDDLLRKAG
ncbi:MAG: ATP-binding protein [Pseudomonadota bacterium]